MLIGEIRRALADSARHPRFVRTVHGVGYAFCGEARDLRKTAPRGSSLADQHREDVPAGEGENIIGRDPACGVWLDSPSVSRRHARLTVESRTRRVAARGPGEHERVPRSRTSRSRAVDLADGDPITIGSVELRVYLWTAEKAAKTARIQK